MSIPSLIAVPAALILALASTVSVAQDKSSATTVSKPVTTLTKPAKVASKSATAPQAATAKSVNQGAGKDVTPAATQSAPLSERSYEGCHHGQDSEA
jgi:hypothetical protein